MTAAIAPVETVATTARSPRTVDPKARAERRLAWTLCAPAVLVMGLIVVYPLVYAIYLSFRRSDLRYPSRAGFVGLDNYVTVLSSAVWWRAVWFTLAVVVASVAVELVLGMGVALLMQRAMFFRNLFRTIVLVPYGIITVVAAFSWQFAWTPHLGWIAGIIGNDKAPLSGTWSAFGIIVLSEIWKATPFMALLLLSGLVLVPDELLEAAAIDGASGWQRFSRIMLPIMKPAVLVALLFRTLDAFRIFDNIFVLENGGTNTTTPVSVLNFNQVFRGLNLGIGSAMAVLIFLITLVITGLFIKGFGAAAPGSDGGR